MIHFLIGFAAGLAVAALNLFVNRMIEIRDQS